MSSSTYSVLVPNSRLLLYGDIFIILLGLWHTLPGCPVAGTFCPVWPPASHTSQPSHIRLPYLLWLQGTPHLYGPVVRVGLIPLWMTSLSSMGSTSWCWILYFSTLCTLSLSGSNSPFWASITQGHLSILPTPYIDIDMLCYSVRYQRQ